MIMSEMAYIHANGCIFLHILFVYMSLKYDGASTAFYYVKVNE